MLKQQNVDMIFTFFTNKHFSNWFESTRDVCDTYKKASIFQLQFAKTQNSRTVYYIDILKENFEIGIQAYFRFRKWLSEQSYNFMIWKFYDLEV